MAKATLRTRLLSRSLKQRGDQLRPLAGIECIGALEPRPWLRPTCENESIVRNVLAAVSPSEAPVRIDRNKTLGNEPGADLISDLSQGKVVRSLEIKRFRNSHRPVHKSLGRGQQYELDALFSQLA